MATPSKHLLYVSSPYQATVNYQKYLFSNKPKLFPHPREMHSEAVMAFD